VERGGMEPGVAAALRKARQIAGTGQRLLAAWPPLRWPSPSKPREARRSADSERAWQNPLRAGRCSGIHGLRESPTANGQGPERLFDGSLTICGPFAFDMVFAAHCRSWRQETDQRGNPQRIARRWASRHRRQARLGAASRDGVAAICKRSQRRYRGQRHGLRFRRFQVIVSPLRI